MSLRAILFDLDGTLVDTLPALRSGYDRFLEELGRHGSDEEFARLAGPRRGVAQLHHMQPRRAFA